MVLPLVFKCSPVSCMDFFVRPLLPGVCIHRSSLMHGTRYVLTEATGLTASNTIEVQQHPDHSSSRYCRTIDNQRNDDTGM